jgi:N-acetylmuramoyl-L-alanine amidase
MKAEGTCSWFGGPEDMGVDPDEGLALAQTVGDAPDLFPLELPADTPALARDLDPNALYIAMRWDYDDLSKEELLDIRVAVHANGKTVYCQPIDWGPHEDTGRICDLSPGAMTALGIETDDWVSCTWPVKPKREGPMRVFISSGHGRYIRGASAILDEVANARIVVEQVAKLLAKARIEVKVFHDNKSTTQDANLKAICKAHNDSWSGEGHDLDVSVHFNAYVETDEPMGTECLYVSQDELATNMANAIAEFGGLTNRGPKLRTDLYFLNHTEAPAILIEVCFVDSSADAKAYKKNFKAICKAIADTIEVYQG